MSVSAKPTFRTASHTSAECVALLVALEVVDLLLRHFYGRTLDALGIQPGSRAGLIGVVFSPLLHANWYHLATNAVPLLVLMTFLLWDARNRPILTLMLIWVLSGLGTWAIGNPETVHIGASSLIYGLVSYLVVAGLLRASWRSVLVALLVGVAFSGIWLGVLPQDGPVSWEGHLCGAIAGVIAALISQR